MNWYLEVFRKYAQFDGRARRKEYWYFALFNFLAAMMLFAVAIGFSILIGRSNENVAVAFVCIVFSLYWLAVLIPTLAVTVRRLHDTNHSGWWYFIAFVPFVGGIILFVFTLLDGDPGPNMYGLDPKAEERYGPVYPAGPIY